jgi:hypothetical protein
VLSQLQNYLQFGNAGFQNYLESSRTTTIPTRETLRIEFLRSTGAKEQLFSSVGSAYDRASKSPKREFRHKEDLRLKGFHRNRCVPTGKGRTMFQLPLPPTPPGNDPHPFGFFDFAMLYVVILQLTLLALSPRVSHRILETLFPILRRRRSPSKAKKCQPGQ